MHTVLALGSYRWSQLSTSIVGLHCEAQGDCPKECKRQSEICCPKFQGVGVLSLPENVSEAQVFYFFQVLKDPAELVKLFQARNFFRVLLSGTIERLEFEQQLAIVNILDTSSIQAIILKSVIEYTQRRATDVSVYLLALDLIEAQAHCALFFKDWTRYGHIVYLWECFVVSSMALHHFFNADETTNLHERLKRSVHTFLVGAHPDNIHKQIVAICVLMEHMVGEEFFVSILEDEDPRYERFCVAFAMHKFMSQLLAA